MRTLIRGLTRIFIALGVVVLLMSAVIGGALWLTLPRTNQTVHIPGLSAQVAIDFDVDGIPRIHAATELDAAAAIGFVHARDRMFQMELMRRAASGRLSEILGPATLSIDRTMRTLGLRNRAVADLAALPPDTKALLDAYARGVNAWITARGRFAAPEFLVLGEPEPWQPVDSLLWGKTMGLWLSSNWRTELSRQALAGKVPQHMIDELWPQAAGAGAPRPDASLPPPIQFAAVAQRLTAMLPRFPGAYTLPDSASNEWAVDGTHSASGAPLLAGDPHLAFGFPGIWYLTRIETPGHLLAGATAPGVPFLVLGHNGRIAWTFTTTGADVQDVFIETPEGPGAYQTPDGPKPFEVREERIKIRGRPDELLTVRETRHGPLISGLDGNDGALMAVAMTNLEPNDTAAAGLLALNRAETVTQAADAATTITSPVQNLLVADRQSIGLFVTGKVPIRRSGNGAGPVPGDGSHDWTGWASGAQLPHFVNPPSGRLVNANEPVAPPDFPVFLGRDAFGDWRSRRIRTLLESSDRHTPADFARMQTDVQSTFAAQVLPALLAVHVAQRPESAAQALLRGWDGAMNMDAPQPLIFNAWIEAFNDAVLRHAGIEPYHGGPVPDFVSFVLDRSRVSAAGVGADEGRPSTSLPPVPPQGTGGRQGSGTDMKAASGEDTKVNVSHDTKTQWCGGDCTPLLQQALATAVRTLSNRFGADPTGWRWGDAHQALFAHPVLRNVPVLDALTTLTIPSPGDDTTIDRGGFNRSLQSVHGAGYRGVYDLADLDRSLFVVTPGQSGNPMSRHARDFLVRWRDGATITLGPHAAVVTATIRLDP